MTDPRVTKVAEILVNYSAKVKKGDNVLILSDFTGLPLVSEIYRLCLRKGAGEIRLNFDSYELDEIYAKNTTAEQRKAFPKMAMEEIKRIDCWFGIICTTNTRGLSGIDPKVFLEIQKAHRPVSNWRVEKTRWVLAQFPTQAHAQEADMSFSDYEDFVYSAVTKANWKKKHKEQEKLRRLLDRTETVRIVGKDTDLTLNVKGRKAENAAGEFNMPDGEVFTSVVEDSAEGFITFSFPAIYLGREFNDVRLEFRKGKVVGATASKGERGLNRILDMDRGARRIGELGIGNNFKIGRFTKNILFDEKIGGSIHLALGRGYKETLSKNKSSLHWDMICDLRESGELYFDGKLVQKRGVWRI